MANEKLIISTAGSKEEASTIARKLVEERLAACVNIVGNWRRFCTAALERELLLRPLGSTVYFMPPYVIDDAQAALLAEGTLELLDRVP